MLSLLSLLDSGDLIPELTTAATTLAVVALVTFLSNWLLFRGARSRQSRGSIPRKLAFFAVCCVGGVAIVLTLPIEQDLRGQMLSLFGLVFTAVVGLGSTTLFSNAMAGLMMRAELVFRVGDFIEVEGQLGRVTERGLFNVEIQLESRDLCTLPNLFLATRPVRVIRDSGTMVEGDVSLGYDVPHDRVTKLLASAAEQAELSEPFVRVMSLGDYSVTYRVSGFLKEVKQLLSARSKLHVSMMDTLHEGGVEIVSPTFMSQRVLDPRTSVIPRPGPSESPAQKQKKVEAESIVFDKADQAEHLDELEQSRSKLLDAAKQAEAEAAKADSAEVEMLKAQAQELRTRAAAIDEELARAKQAAEKNDD